MKIVIITGDPRAGLAHYTSQLALALSADHTVTVLTPRGPIEEYLKGHVEYQILDHPRRMLSPKLFKFYQVAKLVKRIDPDVVHIQSVPPWVGLALPFLRRYPVVITVHDPEIHPGAHGYYILRVANWYMVRRADRLIVHGEFLKGILVRQGLAKNKIEVIPHGDYSFFRRWQKAGVARENAILFFGRITKYKGLEYLFRAAPMLIKQFPDIRIIIAGRNGLGEFEELAKYRDNFEIHNEYVSDEKVAELFQRVKVVVLPYIQASQSGVVCIAYAFKVPVVATNVGAIPEVIDDGITGYLIPPKNTGALSRAVTDLLSDEERRIRMGENAYIKMKRELSWESVAKKTSQVYAHLIGSKKME